MLTYKDSHIIEKVIVEVDAKEIEIDVGKNINAGFDIELHMPLFSNGEIGFFVLSLTIFIKTVIDIIIQ